MAATGRLLDLSMGKVFVQRGGSGPPLLLIHGYLVSHDYFSAVLDELQKQFDVIALDLPGHGESDKPSPDRFAYDFSSLARAVVEVMDALQVPRAHVYGHSMGGGTALTLAAEHTARVERLVIEGGSPYRPVISFTGKLALLSGVGRFIFTKGFGRRDLKTHLKGVFKDKSLATDEMIDFYWERFNRPGARIAGHAILKMFAALSDASEAPARVRAPTLIVWGEEDSLVPIAHGRRLAEQIAGARFEVVGACGHSPHEERPAELLKLVVPFLAARAANATAAS